MIQRLTGRVARGAAMLWLAPTRSLQKRAAFHSLVAKLR